MNSISSSSNGNFLTVPTENGDSNSTKRRVSFADDSNGLSIPTDVLCDIEDGEEDGDGTVVEIVDQLSLPVTPVPGAVSFMYEKMLVIMTREPEERRTEELLGLAPWFRKKVEILDKLEPGKRTHIY